MQVPGTPGFTRRAALGTLGALTLATLGMRTGLAWAQQTDRPPGSLSTLSQRRPTRTPVASNGLVWKGYAADIANVRAEPNTDSAITREVTAGEEVVVPFFV